MRSFTKSMTPPLDERIRSALNAAADPECGLFEIAWSIPVEHGLEARIVIAKNAVRALIDEGYIELHRAEWDLKDELGPYPRDEWQGLLENPYVWGKPHEGWYVIAKLTAAGRAAFEAKSL